MFRVRFGNIRAVLYICVITNQKYNLFLKNIQALANISKTMTTHLARSNRNKGGKASVHIKTRKYLIFNNKSPTFFIKWVIFFRFRYYL